jgi:hypothetical protein
MAETLALAVMAVIAAYQIHLSSRVCYDLDCQGKRPLDIVEVLSSQFPLPVPYDLRCGGIGVSS